MTQGKNRLIRMLNWIFAIQAKRDDKNDQTHILMTFVKQNKATEFGKKYQFSTIKNRQDYSTLVPLHTYDDIQIDIEKMVSGNANILWHGKVPYFSKSSGTTAVSKYIPVTKKALKQNHYKVAKLTIKKYFENRPDSSLFPGVGVIMGGRLQPNPYVTNSNNVGDVSAILQKHAPRYTIPFRRPSLKTGFMENFDEKIDAIIEETKDLNVTYVAGVPSRLTLFMKRLLEKTGKNNIFEVWPNFELFLWGGVSIAPYLPQLQQFLPGDRVWYWQNYNASEGFFATQDKPHVADMILATDHNIFYEFIALSDVEQKQPKTYTIDMLEVGKMYELVLTTHGGLRRYRLGDVVEVTGINPIRIKVAGRTKSYLNTFGEEVMSHTTDEAIKMICEEYQIPIVDYVATTIVEQDSGYHQWFIDFGIGTDMITDDKLDTIEAKIDQYIQDHNSDYKAKRGGDLLMKPLRIKSVSPHSFHRYLESKNKLGGQHKLKKLWNNADELMREMGKWL